MLTSSKAILDAYQNLKHGLGPILLVKYTIDIFFVIDETFYVISLLGEENAKFLICIGVGHCVDTVIALYILASLSDDVHGCIKAILEDNR